MLYSRYQEWPILTYLSLGNQYDRCSLVFKCSLVVPTTILILNISNQNFVTYQRSQFAMDLHTWRSCSPSFVTMVIWWLGRPCCTNLCTAHWLCQRKSAWLSILTWLEPFYPYWSSFLNYLQHELSYSRRDLCQYFNQRSSLIYLILVDQ